MGNAESSGSGFYKIYEEPYDRSHPQDWENPPPGKDKKHKKPQRFEFEEIKPENTGEGGAKKR